MYPSITEALVAERIRGWRDRAARDQLVRQAREARLEARPMRADLPGPRPGSRQPARRAVAPVVVTSGAPQADDECQPAGERAA